MSYYEYKYAIPQEDLPLVRASLQSMYGGSDPFEQGTVTSVYYDTLDREHFQTCLEGSAYKTKYRIRWYNENKGSQAQVKFKNLHQVSKIKYNFKCADALQRCKDGATWHELFADHESAPGAENLRVRGLLGGPLYPCLEVAYHRHRFRTMDFRFNIDSNIQVTGLGRHPGSTEGTVNVPLAVLEIKSVQDRPYLPFQSMFSLPQTAMSKYALGLHLLSHESDVLGKYLTYQD